jgi:hypothetical protein
LIFAASGRPRLQVVGVGLGIGLLAGSIMGALAFGWSIRRHAAAGSSYCYWSGDVDMMTSFTLLGLMYTTRCCWGCPAVRVVRRGSSCLTGSTRGRFAFCSCSHRDPSHSVGPESRLFFTKVGDKVFAPTDYDDYLEVPALRLYSCLL